MRNKALLFALAVALGAGGAWLYSINAGKHEARSSARPSAAELVGQRRPEFTLGSTTGEFIHASDFDGQVLLVNFWATWCKPCREEMPMLSGLRERLQGQGFEVLGIALDDVQQARDFLDELEIDYPNAVGTVDVMALSAAYGNRAGMLPYTVLVDREGIIRWNVLGEVHESDILAELRDLL